jgi:hypothetical protein
LRRVYVFFVIEAGTRHVHVLARVSDDHGPSGWRLAQA